MHARMWQWSLFRLMARAHFIMELKPEIIERIKKLEEKYEAMGQDLASYLDGLLYADQLTYWDYINLDTLLTLQKPRTPFPDEKVFILYHQITELYFKLCLHEIEQIADADPLSGDLFLNKVERVNRYFDALVHSFDIMVDGMDKDQFLKFRMALLPASGFQSAQYREIELCSTDLINLIQEEEVREKYRDGLKEGDLEEAMEWLYWKKGATELATGKKTLTLKQFEEKYDETFMERAKKYRMRNLRQRYWSLPPDQRERDDIVEALRRYDARFNIEWALVHYRSAVRYLQKDPADIAATGGTNWQEFLPPKFQRIVFFPDLWTEEEKAEWGKQWVFREVLGKGNKDQEQKR